MRIQSGKNAGKLSEVVFIKSPDLVQWMIKKTSDNHLTDNFKTLRCIFDKRAITEKLCHGCNKSAIRASAYAGTSSLYFWCAECSPYDSGARSGTLSIVDSFDSAMFHADFNCGGSRTMKRELIRELAAAKGLPARLTEKAVLEFFGQ